MRYSLQLPSDRVDAADEFVNGAAIAQLARAIESAGFDACFVTEHPFPPDRWLESGGSTVCSTRAWKSTRSRIIASRASLL